jgi:cytochrome b-561
MDDFPDSETALLGDEHDEMTPLTARAQQGEAPPEGPPSAHAWNARLQQVQRVSLFAAHLSSLLSVAVVISWIHLLGGLSWKQGESKRIFNWHPLLMVVAFSFMTVASLSFRYKHSSRQYLKTTHVMSWTVAALCALIALIAVFQSHNDPISGFIANLYSLHSWIGCFVIFMYVAQFAIGLFSFAWSPSSLTPLWKARLLIFHRFLGPTIYNGVAITALLGIQEKEGFVGCAYTVTKADTFPISHFWEIPTACRVSHLLGILVLLTALATNLSCHQFVAAETDRRHL